MCFFWTIPIVRANSLDPSIVLPYVPRVQAREARVIKVRSRQLELHGTSSGVVEIVPFLEIKTYLSSQTVVVRPGLRDGELMIEDEQSIARTSLPLQVGQVGELSVQTAGKTQEIVFFPDDMVEVVKLRNLASTMQRSEDWGGKYIFDLSLGPDGLEYLVRGNKTGKFLGLWEMSSPVAVHLSSQTGAMIAQQFDNMWFDRLALLILSENLL